MGTFAGTASFAFVGSYTKASDLTTLTEAVNYSNSPVSYSSGVGSYQADLFYTDTRELASAAESFDLNAATMSDSFGSTLTFVKVKLLFIRNRSVAAGATAERFIVTGDFFTGTTVQSPCFGATTPTFNIAPGGYLLLESPITGFNVTSTTSDVITISNVAAAATFSYDIIILGTSA
jgi:hypothetical protein